MPPPIASTYCYRPVGRLSLFHLLELPLLLVGPPVDTTPSNGMVTYSKTRKLKPRTFSTKARAAKPSTFNQARTNPNRLASENASQQSLNPASLKRVPNTLGAFGRILYTTHPEWFT
ncbi:unnamed protein product [Dovyalis caffra]|uniref:Uncharacterized protein n=1 Tax=Dovyalis caffra TaxID=77055 RepID=A0AAV1S3Z9_9ROSI|nr:unnamed protein product [Dovyalis caffra]